MVRRSRLHAIVFACLVAAALNVPQTLQARDLPIEGGPGGGPFRIQCPSGSFITGFEGRTGAYIDHFRILCGTWDGNARQVYNKGPLQITIGNSGGGGPASAVCPNGWAVAEINFQNTWRDETTSMDGYVHHINLKCVSPAGPESIWRTYGPTTGVRKPSGMVGFPPDYQNCPPGELAVGFQGRAGLYVDALGMICAPVPAPASAQVLVPNGQVTKPSQSLSRGAILGPSGQPAPAPAPPPAPAPNVAANPVPNQSGFTGTWTTRTDKNWSYTITFIQNGHNVSGSYVAQNGDKGRINGHIRDNVLDFNWTQDGGFKGTGQFALAPDGNSFTGIYRSEPNKAISDPRLLQGSWNGTRR